MIAKRPWPIFILALLGMAAAIPAGAADATKYLVVFQSEQVDAVAATRAVEAAGGKVVRGLFKVGMAIADSKSPDFARALERRAAIASVREDRKLQLEIPPVSRTIEGGFEEAETIRAQQPGTALAGFVEDPTQAPLYELVQWHLPAMKAPEAWALGHVGDPAITVAIVDSGIDYTHPELADRVDLSRSVSFVPEDDAIVAQRFPGIHPSVDLNFHGTHQAGIIACNARRLACVAPNVTLIAVKVANKDWETTPGRIVSGILHAVEAGAEIINMSFFTFYDGSDPADRHALNAIRRAIRAAEKAGVTVIATAGFGFPDPFDVVDADHNGTQVIVPAEAGAIVVSSTDPDELFSLELSNFGHSLVDISAPGGRVAGPDEFTAVFSTCSSFSLFSLTTELCLGRHVYIEITGALNATAHASGLAALLESAAGGTLGVKEIRQQLFKTVDDLGHPGRDAFFGRGRINALRALTE